MKAVVSGLQKNKEYWFIACVWLVVELILFWHFGFNYQLEAGKYINQANIVLETSYVSQARYLFYISTIFIIAFNLLIKTGLEGAIIMIMIINLFSYLYFYKALKFVFKSRLPAFIIIFFLFSFWPFQSWSLFLYTECLFYSSVLVLFSRLLLFKTFNFKFIMSLFCILIWVILSRPLGILFIFPVLFFIFFHLTKKQKFIFSGIFIMSLLILNWVVQIVFTTTPDWTMEKSFLEGNIICDMPGTINNTGLVISDSHNQLYRLFYYITHNFSHFANLDLTRLKYFFLNTRTYYSTLHNFYLLIYLIAVYSCIIVGVKNIRKVLSLPQIVFIITTVLFFAFTIALQCDDYHNRFFLTLFPLLTVLAVAGLAPIIKKIETYFQKSF